MRVRSSRKIVLLKEDLEKGYINFTKDDMAQNMVRELMAEGLIEFVEDRGEDVSYSKMGIIPVNIEAETIVVLPADLENLLHNIRGLIPYGEAYLNYSMEVKDEVSRVIDSVLLQIKNSILKERGENVSKGNTDQ